MPGASYPPILKEPIASDAGGSFITNPMPDAPPSSPSNAASVQQGFPAITMQSELSGGLPPFGQDMNGFLFLVSSHTMYVQCGQTYQYNATLAGVIGGYLAGTILGMADGTGLWLNNVNGNTSNPDTGGAGWVPIAAYGTTTVSGLTGGTVTLTPTQTKYSIIILNGVLTGNLTVNLPQTQQEWLIVNQTSGAFTTTVKTAAGGSLGVNVPQGGFGAPVGVYSVGDGNIYPTVAPLGAPIDQNPNPLTIVERTNTGAILATYFNSNTGYENPTIGGVVVQNSAADGNYRKITLTNFEAQLILSGLGGQVSNAQVPYSAISQWASALFFSPELSGAPVAPTQPLGTSDGILATTAFANPGVTVNSNGIGIYLPSGYKLQAGTVNPGGGSAVATFPIPFTSSVFPVAISVAGGAVQTWLSGVGLNNMTVHNSGGTSYWFAIGI